jgi:peroxiredoxin Q/BCP
MRGGSPAARNFDAIARRRPMAMWSKLKKAKAANTGDVAPDFDLSGTTGPGLKLSDLRGKKRAVLFFYPQDCTSGCLAQLTEAGQVMDEFRALDTEPFGVNEAEAESHQIFLDQLDIPFDLLVDRDFKVSRAYDALKEDQDRISRTVVVVGKNGKVIFRAAGAPPATEILREIANAKDS